MSQYASQHSHQHQHDDKFRNLPDIDRESPDTYETPDSLLPSDIALGYDISADPVPVDTDPHIPAQEEGVVHSRLPLATAKSRFHGAGVDATAPGPSGLRTYDKSKYDALLRARTATETPLQRLARLKAEALELEEQLQAGVHSPSSPDAPSSAAAPKYADAFAQLSALTKSLDQVAATAPMSANAADGGVTANRLLEHIKAFRDSAATSPAPYRQFSGTDYSAASMPPPTGATTTADTITYEVYYTPDSATLIRSTKLADLDTRLATLERLLGHHVEPDLVPSEPLVGMLARIDRQLQYLANPRNLDALTRQLRTVNDQLNAAARHSAGPTPQGLDLIDGDLAAKLTQLYALVNKLDPLLPVIPRVLERLQSLQSLHAEAAQVTGAVRKTVLDVARTERTMRDVDDSVKQLQASFRENAEVTAKNVEALESRVRELAARVERLV